MMLQVTEILDNAIDEVQAGHASNVQVLMIHRLITLCCQCDTKSICTALSLSEVVAGWLSAFAGSAGSTDRLGHNLR